MQGQLEAVMDEVFEPTPGNLAPLHAQALDLSRLVDDLGTLANAIRPTPPGGSVSVPARSSAG